MRRKHIIAVGMASVLFALSVTGMQRLQTHDHLFGGAVTPEVAVRDSLQVQANGLRNFRVITDQWIDFQRFVVFSYEVQVPGEPLHGEFGFALAEMRRGWSARPGSMYADAPAPNAVTFSATTIGDTTIVYGKVLRPDVSHVDVRFADKASTGHIVNGGFVVMLPRGQSLSELRAVDANGNVIQQIGSSDLNAPARWE